MFLLCLEQSQPWSQRGEWLSGAAGQESLLPGHPFQCRMVTKAVEMDSAAGCTMPCTKGHCTLWIRKGHILNLTDLDRM